MRRKLPKGHEWECINTQPHPMFTEYGEFMVVTWQCRLCGGKADFRHGTRPVDGVRRADCDARIVQAVLQS